MTTIRLGLAQTVARFGGRESENLARAVALVREAAELGVDLLAFAENYPGPFTESFRYDVAEAMAAAAREHGVAVAYGTSLPDRTRPGSYNIATVVLDGDGEERGCYRRTHPIGPYIYRDSPEWNFDYVAADDFPVIEMPWGTLGISICSEVHLPEISRILALQGAEVILYPSGLLIHELGYTESWQTLVYARAIENHCYTATLVNLMDRSVGDQFAPEGESGRPGEEQTTRGIGLIASPEGVLARSSEPGILTADLDLERVRYLRRTEEQLIVPAPYRTIPGHHGWRRPELYARLSTTSAC
ncbi:carbon-nitrogen hydrolase family protein [Nocardioides carbamazepini]|uniref:carbon-nitrogen hydrolase family protein n=1 Tax=Nocardioides carbamazepini TaxID=2854259 RepID=UPI00214A0090|nr:carbon-nitrogen hydrolase family protein [Nocardioides carbamazepini]MCR1781083.1 carbon-nitrogen hydrolase family protein [Nocardioides carbamazepini]